MAIKSIETEVECKIIPRLTLPNELTLVPGDTVVAHAPESWDVELMQELYKLLQAAFPHNNILILPHGTDLSIIKERNSANNELHF